MMVDLWSWDRARVIGAVEEAETLGADLVGTEHLLLATLDEPVVRWAFRTAGVDRAGLQAEIVRGGTRRRTRHRGLTTKDAGDAIVQVSDVDDSFSTDDLTDAQVSRLLRLLARQFLSRRTSSEARAVLDRLGVLAVRSRVLATIEHNARALHDFPTRSTERRRNDGAARRPGTVLGRRPFGPSAG